MFEKPIVLWACWFNCDGPKPSTRYYEAQNSEDAINMYLEELENSKYSNVPKDTVRCKQLSWRDIKDAHETCAQFLYFYIIEDGRKTGSVMADSLADAVAKIEKQEARLVKITVNQVLQ